MAGHDRRTRDLRIDRADLPRQYDVGGLVDISSAPVGVLRESLGLTADQTTQVVETRLLERPVGSAVHPAPRGRPT